MNPQEVTLKNTGIERKNKIVPNSNYFRINNGYDIFYTSLNSSNKVWFICNPLFEEALYSYDVLKNFSNFTHMHDYSSIRHDYTGTGNSDGELLNSTIDNWILESIELINSIAKDKEIHLLGLRYGAVIASKIAKSIKTEKLILWAPIFDSEDYFQKLLKYNIATQYSTHKKIDTNSQQLEEILKNGKSIEVQGFEINDSFSSSLRNNHLEHDACENTKIIFSNQREYDAYLKYTSSYTFNNSPECIIIKQAPFWIESKMYYSEIQDFYNASLD